VREVLDRLGFDLKPREPVMYLSRAQQQMVEIAKAFRTRPSIMIFDEPTASLTERETDRLFALIEQIKAEGIGIIYITHRMNEIKRIGDRITVLRDGKFIATIPVEEASDTRLVELMTGRVIDQIFPTVRFQPGETMLEVEHLTAANGDVRDVSINVRRGEIVGLAGLVGSGKSQIGRACFGLEKLAGGRITFDGEVVFEGRKRNLLKPRRMLDRGLYYLPSDRRQEGLVMMQNVRENVALSSLWLSTFSNALFLRRGNERSVVKDLAHRLDLAPLNIERDLEHFSGGNQQKVLVGKSLAREVKLFIFDEPTVGVDVGARVHIYNFIKELCEAGAGVLLISSDLPEILHLPSRAYVMYRGELRAELSRDEISEQTVLSHFFEKRAA
jgi:ribose transport system ATP-binding protein